MNQYPLKTSPRSTTGFRQPRNGAHTGRKQRASVRQRNGQIPRQVERFNAWPARTHQVRASAIAGGNQQVECERALIRLSA